MEAGRGLGGGGEGGMTGINTDFSSGGNRGWV